MQEQFVDARIIGRLCQRYDIVVGPQMAHLAWQSAELVIEKAPFAVPVVVCDAVHVQQFLARLDEDTCDISLGNVVCVILLLI